MNYVLKSLSYTIQISVAIKLKVLTVLKAPLKWTKSYEMDRRRYSRVGLLIFTVSAMVHT